MCGCLFRLFCPRRLASTDINDLNKEGQKKLLDEEKQKYPEYPEYDHKSQYNYSQYKFLIKNGEKNKIGEGAFSGVYLVEKDNKQYAMKVIQKI